MDNSDVVINYKPFREIVILEQTRFSTPEELARFTSVITGGKLAGLYWAEGVLFLYFPLPPSNNKIAKIIIEESKVYWSFVGYSLMPTYCGVIETKEKILIPVVDISSNLLLKKVANWLKTQK